MEDSREVLHSRSHCPTWNKSLEKLYFQKKLSEVAKVFIFCTEAKVGVRQNNQVKGTNSTPSLN